MSTIDDIKAKIDLAEYLREQGVQLKPAGSSLKACCPFHNEKSPSFMVNRQKQVYHCFGCFVPGTLVKTPRGFHHIEALRAGERVISGSGNDQRIIRTHEHLYHGDLVGVRIRKLGGVVHMTHDHRVPVIRGAPSTRSYKVFARRFQRYLSLSSKQCDRKLQQYFPVVELPAEQLRTGDLVLYPIADTVRTPAPIDLSAYIRTRAQKGPKPPALPERIVVDNNLLRFVGLWVAEGSSHRAYVRFSFGPREMHFAEEVRELCRRLFGLSVGIHVRPARNGIEVSCCHAYLAQVMEEWCGKGAGSKHVPFEFQDLPPSQQRVLLGALCDGDGTEFIPHRSQNRHRSYTTISRTLAEQVVDIVLRCGYFPTFSVKKAFTDAKDVHHREAHTVAWSEEARQKYHAVLKRNGVRYWLLPIVNIERKPYHGPVYNLTVGTDHSYIATNFAVANCGKGGDLFTFLQEREGLEFGEALRLLADRAGVQLERHDPRLEGQKTRSLAVLELAAKWLHHQLTKTPGGEVARQYVAQRGIRPETVEQFQIGYAPDTWGALTSFLISRKFTSQEIVEAGLAIPSRQSTVDSRQDRSRDGNLTTNDSRLTTRVYDRFRHRLVFPIHDLHGRIVGCTARILDGATTVGPAGETPAKYVNTPETAIYKKGAMLYGLWQARDAIRTIGYAVLVEGQMDVIASHEAGFPMAIAVSGTALTPEQLHLLKRFTTTMHVAFDADPAGEGAAERGIDAALDAGFDVRVIRMPTGPDGKPIAKDADECVRRHPDAWREAVAHPTPVLAFFIERVRERFDLRAPSGQREAGRVLVQHIQHVADPIERAAWIRMAAEAIGVPEHAVRESLARAGARTGASQAAVPSAAVGTPAVSVAERLLAILVRYPEHVPAVRAIIPNGEVLESPYASLYNQLVLGYSGQHEGDGRADGSTECLQLLADREFSEWEPAAIAREAATCARSIRKQAITEELRTLADRMRQAEHGTGGARDRALSDLERRFEDLRRALAAML